LPANVLRNPRGSRLKSPLQRNTGKSVKFLPLCEISRDRSPHVGRKSHWHQLLVTTTSQHALMHFRCRNAVARIGARPGGTAATRPFAYLRQTCVHLRNKRPKRLVRADAMR
jgi:hypothetical protein